MILSYLSIEKKKKRARYGFNLKPGHWRGVLDTNKHTELQVNFCLSILKPFRVP